MSGSARFYDANSIRTLPECVLEHPQLIGCSENQRVDSQIPHESYNKNVKKYRL